MRVVAGGHQQEEAHHDLVVLELLAVDLGVDEHARQVVGRVLAALGDQLRAALEDLRHVASPCTVSRPRGHVGVAGAEHRVHDPRPDRVVLRRDAHEAADHARDDRLRDVVDEVARPRARRGGRAPRRRSARIASSCSAIRFGVKPRWNSAFRRSCFGGSMPMNIACSSSSGRIAFVERRDAAELRGVGLPVAADLVDVVGRGDRPEAFLVRDTRSIRRVQWTGHRARISLNSSCGGPSAKFSPVADPHAVERLRLVARRCHRSPPPKPVLRGG